MQLVALWFLNQIFFNLVCLWLFLGSKLFIVIFVPFKSPKIIKYMFSVGWLNKKWLFDT